MKQAAIVTELRCPICGRKYHEARISIGGNCFPSCQGKRCRAKWWACRLAPGVLKEQLIEEFNADDDWWEMFRGQNPDFPEEIVGDAYLQIVLAPEVAYNAPSRGIKWILEKMGWAA